MRMPAIMETICRAGAIVAAACAVAFWGAGIPTAAAFMAGGTLLLLLYSLKSAASEGVSLKPSFNLQGFRLLVSGAWPVAASTLTYSLYCRTPVLMLTALAGAVETANFATAYKLYEFGLMPVYLLGLAVFPALSRQFDQPPASFVSLAKSYLKTSILFGALLAWGLLFVVPSTLVFILGADFAATEAATRLIAVVAFLAAIDLAFLRISLALHLQQLRLRIQVAAMVVNFAAGFALIPQFGALGAIASFIIAQLVMIGLYLRALVSLPQCAGLARTALLGAAISGSALATGAVAVQRSLPEWTVAGLTLAVLAAALFGGGFIPWQQLRGRALR
jgi:O-antigen/teichoic acid export membrane protein